MPAMVGGNGADFNRVGLLPPLGLLGANLSGSGQLAATFGPAFARAVALSGAGVLTASGSTGVINSGADIKANTSLVGLQVTTTRTEASGYDFDTLSKITSYPNLVGGSGTYADPYRIDRVLYGSNVTGGGPGLGSVCIKLTRSRGYGNPGNPTPGGSFFLGNNSGVALGALMTEDSEWGPNSAISGTGGPATGGGCDKGVQAFCPLVVRRCNVWGANINIYLQTEKTDAASNIDSNYVHDTWSASGDHTDSINGNQHASHVTIQKNYVNGIRTGNSFVTNAIGIYDDPATSAGLITDWTIDANYLENAATLILSSTSTTRFSNPFVFTNNYLGAYSLQQTACRSPSSQSGNSGPGGPLTI